MVSTDNKTKPMVQHRAGMTGFYPHPRVNNRPPTNTIVKHKVGMTGVHPHPRVNTLRNDFVILQLF